MERDNKLNNLKFLYMTKTQRMSKVNKTVRFALGTKTEDATRTTQEYIDNIRLNKIITLGAQAVEDIVCKQEHRLITRMLNSASEFPLEVFPSFWFS